MQLPPDPEIIIPIAGMFTGIVITGFVVLGPIGRTIGDVIRHLFGLRRRDEALSTADAEELRRGLEDVRQQLAELAERQDFTERVVAQARDKGAIGSGGKP